MDTVFYLIFLFFRGLIFITPRCALPFFSRLFARFVWLLTPRQRRIIARNLSHFCGLFAPEIAEQKAICIYRRFAYYIFLMLKNEGAPGEKLLEQISEFDGGEEFASLLARGEKIVFFTAHFGYWELLPPAVALHFGCKLSIVGRPLRHKKINERLTKSREEQGVELIEKTGAAKKLLRSAKNGHILGLVTDQDAHPQESCELKFFGKKITQSKSAAVIAQKIDAFLLPVFILPDGRKFKIKFLPACRAKERSIEQLCEFQNQAFEEIIRAHPEEYFFFHKKFKTFYEAEY